MFPVRRSSNSVGPGDEVTRWPDLRFFWRIRPEFLWNFDHSDLWRSYEILRHGDFWGFLEISLGKRLNLWRSLGKSVEIGSVHICPLSPRDLSAHLRGSQRWSHWGTSNEKTKRENSHENWLKWTKNESCENVIKWKKNNETWSAHFLNKLKVCEWYSHIVLANLKTSKPFKSRFWVSFVFNTPCKLTRFAQI